uniref:DDE_Tnp_ISL3 domain-containing protein n=1 Tax=Heterorhabditis bacteriophora TaxID=37862 RepID=A0A1I7W8Z1_HETBA
MNQGLTVSKTCNFSYLKYLISMLSLVHTSGNSEYCLFWHHISLIFRNTYLRSTCLLSNEISHKYLNHSQNFDPRTTNVVEGYHTRIRAAFPGKSYFIPATTFFFMIKCLTASIANGTLAPRYIRPAELQHQEEIQDYMKNSQQFLLPLNGACLLPGTLPFLDCCFLLIYSNGLHYIYGYLYYVFGILKGNMSVF